MKYYCFYLDYEMIITDAIIVMTYHCDKIDEVMQVLRALGYTCMTVGDINDFVEYAKDKTDQIKILIL